MQKQATETKTTATTKPATSVKRIKKRAIQHSSNMSIVTFPRKHWVRLQDGRLVSKFKVRLESTGRETLIDPVKYQANFKRFYVVPDAVSVMNLHYTHELDLSRDAIQTTSEIQRKRGGILTEQELEQAAECAKLLKEHEKQKLADIEKLGLSKKKYYQLELERYKQSLETESAMKIVHQVVSAPLATNNTVDFLSDDDELKDNTMPSAALLNGLFDSDSE